MRTRETLSALIEERLSSSDGRSELVKLATRPILEESLETETGDALGREYYEHGAEDINPFPPTSRVAPHGENKSRQRYRYNQIRFKVAVVVAVQHY